MEPTLPPHNHSKEEGEDVITSFSRRRLRLLCLAGLALVFVLVEYYWDEVELKSLVNRETYSTSKAYTKEGRTSQMIPNMAENGGVVVFWNIDKSGGVWLRYGLQNEELSLGHVHFEYRNATTLTELQAVFQETSRTINTPTSLIKKVLFVEVSIEATSQSMAIIQHWRKETEKAGIPFFAFTMIRESISSQMAFWRKTNKQLRNQLPPGEKENIIVDNLPSNPQCSFMASKKGDSFPQIYQSLRQNMDWIGRTDRLREETIPLLFKLMFGRPQLGNKLAENFRYRSGNDTFSKLQPATRQRIQNISAWDEQMYQSISRDYSIQMWNNFVPLDPNHVPPSSYHPQGFLNPYQDPSNRQALLRRTILTQRDQPTSSRAYVMMLWGADPDAVSESNPLPPYRGYLANMLVAAKILRDNNSTADFVAVFKMQYGSPHDTLPSHEEEMLRSNGIKIRYMPQEVPEFERFYQKYSPRGVEGISWDHGSSELVNKLWVYTMADYERAMFLDGDLIPLTTLDYLFDMSEGPKPLIKENFVLATHGEPSNAGLFMVRPNRTAYQDILQLIADRGDTIGVRSRFDEVQGWGHVIQEPDKWETNRPEAQGREWNYLVASSDQGLIYHYPKYVLRSMTQILSRKVINFGPGPNGTVVVERTYNITSFEGSPFSKHAPDPKSHVNFHRCEIFGWSQAPGYPGCLPPYSDHAHFTGSQKPWKNPPAPPGAADQILWWQTLRSLQRKQHHILGSSA